MTFVHPLLLGGLILVGIPVLLHLIMRQQPKHLRFPAMRFLVQQARTNQRKLRLRHLLLLLLRMALLALFCLALARPKIFSERFNFSSERPVAAVLVFDTSFSMEYTAAGKTRLDEAKRRALELLDDMPSGSRLAVLDTAEPGGEWLASPSQARERINNLELRPANYPVTAQLIPAYDLFAKLDEEADLPDEAPTRFLYVFSDRTQACWNATHLDQLQKRRDQMPPDSVRSIFVDVGVEHPAAVAVTNLELPQQTIYAHQAAEIRATVQAIGEACDTEIQCRFDKGEAVDRRPVRLDAGQSKVIVFKRANLSPGMHQAEARLASGGTLPFTQARYATFEVLGARKVLTIVDNAADATIWKLALETGSAFHCDVKTTTAFQRDVFPKELEQYKAVCMLGVAEPTEDMWRKLDAYVRNGGGLAIIPGDAKLEAYNGKEAQRLLPGRLVKTVTAKPPNGIWSAATYQHPFMAKFAEWSKDPTIDFLQPGREPLAKRYWEVELPANRDDAYVIVSYAEKNPALLERNFDRNQYRGRVLLFTTPMDDAHLRGASAERWNTYLEDNSFYFVLARKTIGYLAGDTEARTFNYQSGQSVPIALPKDPNMPNYVVQGPGLDAAEGIVPYDDSQKEVRVTKAVQPGNFKVFDKDGKALAAFSMNVSPDETQLARVPVEQIEALFGPNAVLPIDQKMTLHDALQSHWNQPVELLPWLMILLLLVLVVENLLSNKFYRREPDEKAEEASKRVEETEAILSS